ncbi:MAG: hypothetical protein ACEPO8_02850 [Rhodothermaceae bacterium]
MNCENNISARGFCPFCSKEHFLYEGNAKNIALELIEKLEKYKRLDYEKSNETADPKFFTDYVFGKALGQMFGVLECKNEDGEIVILKAFSGQYNGIWKIENWVPPLLDVKKFDQLVLEEDKKIKKLGKEIEILEEDSIERKDLVKKRKELSRALLRSIYELYELHNFKGEKKSLFDLFGNKGIPTGTGDCCAPKLLNYAAKNGLKPLSLAEFYFGKENLSKTKQHKIFYPSCKDKCYPILGFMLCGAENE